MTVDRRLRIEPLASSHKRGAFCCGVTTIDNFFRNNARRDHEAYKVRVFVGFLDGVPDPVGFYSLTLTALNPKEVSEQALEKFARVGATPAIYLAMIAVTKDYQKKKFSFELMDDAFTRALAISENAGAYALTLDALNDDLVELYKSFGFEPFEEGERKMFIPLSVLRKAREA